MNYQAYLIVICDNDTNAVLGSTIWSTPEWEQSRNIGKRTYVAYAVRGKDFASAKKDLIHVISQETSRYHWLLELLDK